MQQVISDFSAGRFTNNVNALLMDGWRVVPGTYVASSMRLVADEGSKRDRPEFVLPDGTMYRLNYFIVLENVTAH